MDEFRGIPGRLRDEIPGVVMRTASGDVLPNFEQNADLELAASS